VREEGSKRKYKPKIEITGQEIYKRVKNKGMNGV
jgi:hypothetical protein